jgi:pyruvate,water dikinase
MKNKQIVWFKNIHKDDIDLVGGKGANLGEMVSFGIPVPPGFIITAPAYHYFIKKNNLKKKIKHILEPVDIHDPQQLNEATQKIRQLIDNGKIPKDLSNNIIHAYEQLGGKLKQTPVAIRSSATAEDLPDASFAGQQETYLNVHGETNVINKVRSAWASLFTPRATFYREEKGFNHFKVGIAVPVQKMVQSSSSGVMFTIDPVTNDKSKIIIEAIWGLGELIVQGSVTPDHYKVNKSSLEIVKKQINEQDVKMIRKKTSMKTSKPVDNDKVKVRKQLQGKQKLSDKKIIELAKLGKKIHQHYFFPQDIEWAVEKNKLYILQTRPVTTTQRQNKEVKAEEEKRQKIDLPLVLKGDPASPGIGTGYAKIINSAENINKVKKGEVLVTEMTTPDFVPAMKRVSAIITDKGGQTSHAAIVSRELGVPCVVGTKKGTKVIDNKKVVTVDGKTGSIYSGGMQAEEKKKIASVSKKRKQKKNKLEKYGKHPSEVKTATKVYVNLGDPELAKEISKKNVDGVGLLRAEFMISQSIGIHPKKLIEDGKEEQFTTKLADGLTTFCKAFKNRPVVYRATDFKTNEYRNLKGGKYYENEEENPLIGYRGAFRYIKDEKVFELELEAIKRVINKRGLKNLWMMIPFVRTVEELKKVKKIISSNGLHRSPSFQLWMMVEIPSNVISLEHFLDVGIDGVSVGTNDLTMLTLGIDRDNEVISPEFDERDQAVLWSLKRIIKTCNKKGVTSSICGQAPSIYPDLTEKLVKWGITSVSVSPDMIEQTRENVFLTEKRIVTKNNNG